MAVTRQHHVLTPDPSKDKLPQWYRTVAVIVSLLRRGKLIPVNEVTLTANSATTTLTDPNIGANSAIFFDPRTANAASALQDGSFYLDTPGDGSVTINHTNDANADKTFKYVVFG